MVQEADDNKDGAVDIEEFVKAVLVVSLPTAVVAEDPRQHIH